MSPDFPSGVIRKLVHKMTPDWDLTIDPATRALDFFPDPSTPLRPSTPALELEHPIHGFDKYHFRAFGLPAESEIEAVVRGNHKTSGDLAMDERRVLGVFQEKFDWTRRGTKERVLEVLDRMTLKNRQSGFLVWSPAIQPRVPAARRRAAEVVSAGETDSSTGTPKLASVYPTAMSFEAEMVEADRIKEEETRVKEELEKEKTDKEAREKEEREAEVQMRMDEEERAEREADEELARREEGEAEREEEEVDYERKHEKHGKQ